MNENEKEYINFARSTNKTLEEKGSQYRVVYLPERDLMPYYHIDETTGLEDKIAKVGDILFNGQTVKPVVLSKDEADLVNIALAVYKAALFSVYGEMIRHNSVKNVVLEKSYGEEGCVGFPMCPTCDEFAYGIEKADENGIGQCPFCGQRYKYKNENRA